ncbi:MAG: hypothetical protein GX567_18750, partial [Clostridia bacterium]|nr:hypothetical protein [Clostridia bacterium]
VSGRVPALLAMITCYLIPSLLFSAFEVSQQILFTVLILAALLICMKFSSLSKEIELREQRPGGYIRSVFLGLILGFASVTDVSGILIALIIFALILSYKKGNISYVLVSFLFMCATGFLYIYDYINITKVNINDFIHSYLNEWIPNQISFPLFDHITRDNMRELNFFDGMKFSNGFMDTIIKLDDQFMIFLLLSVVIGCIFYFKKRTRAMFPVYLCTIAVCIFGVCKIGNGNYQILLSCMVIVLFSQYLRNSYDFFVFNETLGEAPDDETEMIENPLPMPAKHVAKCLDYDQQIEENVEFDIELDQETDDWDV